MPDLDAVPADDLRAALDEHGDPPTLRLVVALAYRDGVPVAEVADRYGLPERTVYDWLGRFDDAETVEDAVFDASRPGRPPALDDEARAELAWTLRRSPSAAGYDAEAWTPALLREHVDRAFGVDYSVRHVRRLFRELGPGE